MLRYDQTKLISLLFGILSLAGAVSCSRPPEPYQQTKLKMGTFVSISIFDQDLSDDALRQVIEGAFACIDSVERKTSRHLPESELSYLNREAGKRTVQVDSLLDAVLKTALKVAEKTEGRFDPTIGPLVELWGFGSERMHRPAADSIALLLPLVGYQNLLRSETGYRFARSGMEVDLGGIAKGTAIDAAAAFLKRSGISDFMVDAGGDLAIASSQLTRGRIRVWIRHPRKPQGLFGYFFLDDGFVATSGDYEQYFVLNNRRFHHILNPATGYPDSDLMSVTVLAPTAELADAYSTALFVMGKRAAQKFASEHPELQVVLLWDAGDKIGYWASENLLKKLRVSDESIKEQD